ncbi:MAG TPA: WD40 repeat domain-containing protein, partial [Myxococcota bacterium]
MIRLASIAVATLALSAPALASQSQVHVVEGQHDLLGGDLDGTALSPDGVVRVGPALKQLTTDALTGPVLALARGGDGALYAATASPGRVWKIVEGSKPEVILESDKALVTAVLPVGKQKLVALTAPDGGAEVIDLGTKKHETVLAKDAKMLLAGAVIDDVVYAVGGGDEGVLLKLAPNAKAWEVVAKTKEAQLRSIAVAKVNGVLKIVVGGGEEGVIYDVTAGKVRALLDTAPTEITALAIGADGTVFASAVDGEGKLSKGAVAKAKDDASDDKLSSAEKDKKQKARKVKSAEVWRIDPQGRARVLWQSKDHGAYALALLDGKLLAGTGPEGRIYEIDESGGRAAGVFLRMKDHDEVTALRVEGESVLFGTAHAPAVVRADKSAATRGVYLSPALDGEALARYGAVASRGRGSITLSVRTGNTKEPDDTWSAFSAPTAAPLGQYAQVRAELTGKAELEGV